MRCGLCPGEGLDADSLGTHLGAVHFCAMSALLQSKIEVLVLGSLVAHSMVDTLFEAFMQALVTKCWRQQQFSSSLPRVVVSHFC